MQLLKNTLFTVFLCLFYSFEAFADTDPLSRSATEMSRMLFGGMGTSLCTIIIGATFLMAKIGKISWDRFVQVGICTAGFLGAPSIVMMIQKWAT